MDLNIENLSKEQLNKLKELIENGQLLNQVDSLLSKTEESRNEETVSDNKKVENIEKVDKIIIKKKEEMSKEDIVNQAEKIKEELINYFKNAQNKDFDSMSLKDKVNTKLGIYLAEYILLNKAKDISSSFSQYREYSLATIIMQLVYKKAELEGYKDEEIINIYTDNLDLFIPCILEGEGISITELLDNPIKYLPRGIGNSVRKRYPGDKFTYIRHEMDEMYRVNQYNIGRLNKDELKFNNDKTTDLYNRMNFYFERPYKFPALFIKRKGNDISNVLIEYYLKNDIDYTSDYENNRYTDCEFLVSEKYRLDTPNFFETNWITSGNEKEKDVLIELIGGIEYSKFSMK